MEHYSLLLRNINIGGKHKVVMKTLKEDLEKIGFEQVQTILNSGNILFKSMHTPSHLNELLKQYLSKTYEFDIPFLLNTTSVMHNIIEDAPTWWDVSDKRYYHIFVFVLPTSNTQNVQLSVGELRPEYELLQEHEHGFYASILLSDFSKSRWGNIANTPANIHTTIRTRNTIQKLVTKSQ